MRGVKERGGNMEKEKLENKSALIWKMAIASAISWELAKWIGSSHPYLAPLSVVLCLQTTIDQSIRYSFHRIMGTVIGIILTAYLASHLDMNGWNLGLLIVGGVFIAKWLRVDESVLHQVALTIILIFTFERKSKDYALDRILDSIIGVTVAILIHMFIFPPNFTKKAAKSLQKLAHGLSEILLELSHWVQSEWGNEKGFIIEDKINHFLQELHDTKDILNTASNSLKFNPFSKKHQNILSDCHSGFKKINKGYGYVSTTVETLKRWEKKGDLSSAEQIEVGNHLKALSEFYGKMDFLQQNQLNDEIGILFNTLPPNCDVFRGSFFLETEKLIKKLRTT